MGFLNPASQVRVLEGALFRRKRTLLNELFGSFEGVFFMPDSGFLLIDCLDLFLLDRRAQNLADKSIDIYRRRLRGFVLWCTENDLQFITIVTSTMLVSAMPPQFRRRPGHHFRE